MARINWQHDVAYESSRKNSQARNDKSAERMKKPPILLPASKF